MTAADARPLLPGVSDEITVGAGWFLGWLVLTIVVVVLNENVRLARPIIWGSLGLIDVSLAVSNATKLGALVDKFIADMGGGPPPPSADGRKRATGPVRKP
jgi:hypothetical protein